MGSAGFRRRPDFFDRLVECRRRGAALHSYDAFRRGEPVVVADRWAAIRDDPAWAPMREYLAELAWESFVSVPLLPGAGPRSRAAGVLNVFLDPAVAGPLTRRVTAAPSGVGALTGRERAALVLLAQGRSNRELAAELVISERTVRNHVTAVLRKLQVTSRTQAALLAVREGLLPPGAAVPAQKGAAAQEAR